LIAQRLQNLRWWPSFEGHPSLPFWQAIYKPRKAYWPDTVTGWIADLFPFLGDAPDRRRNHVFQFDREDWAIPVEAGVKTRGFGGEPGAEKGVPPHSFPSGLSSVPVKLSFSGKEHPELELDLVAGFFGIEQDAVNLALSPIVSWSVTQRAPENPVLIFNNLAL
jgi:Domain of unknown function (DUF4419)